jgi:PAS domain S-box-containing protein
MKQEYSSPATPHLRRLSRYMTLSAFFISMLVLVGWMSGSEFLKRLMPDASAMNPLSAICFLLCAYSLWIQREGNASGKRLRNGRWMAGAVAMVGLAKLLSVIFGIDFYLDTLLFPDQMLDPVRNIMNLMSPNSAICFIFIGLALFWLDYEIRGTRRPAQYFSMFIMFIAILSLYGYVYGVKYLYGIYSFKPMSLISALNFLLLAVAILFSRPEKGTMAIIIGDTSAEITLLRLAAFLIPLIMGWLKLKGEQRGYYNTEFGTALFAIMTYALAMFLLARRSVVNYKMRALKREAQDELQKAHDRFLKFFNLSPEAKIITAVEDGRILYMNKAFEELMKIRSEDALGKTTTDLNIISLEERAKVVQSIRDEGLNKGIELKLKAGDGEVKDILISLEMIELDDRSCFLTNYLDITKRKKLEDALRESEQLLRAILDNMGEGVEVVDARGKFLLVNPMAEELVGRRINDNAHSDWIRKGVFYPDGVTPYPSEELALHEALSGRPVDNMEFKVRDENIPGGRIIRSTSRPIRDKDGQVIGGVSVMNDITKRKEIEQQLRNSEERMRLIINTSLDAFIGMDEKGRITDWNRQAEITFGWSREEVIGRELSETIIPERYRHAHTAGLRHYLVSGEGPVLNKRIEIEAWHRHGYEFPIELTITALKLGEESIFCAFAHDITARRKHVEEIRQSGNFLNAILENIPNMIFVKDADELRFIRFNKAGEELLGYSRDDLMGKNDYDFFPKEQADFFTEKDREVIRNNVLVNIPEEPIETKKWPAVASYQEDHHFR